MPRLLRKPSSARPVGLDVDGRHVAAVELEGRRVVKAAAAEVPVGAVRDGEVADEEALSEALKDLFASNGLSRTVHLGVANQHIVVRQIDLPEIDDEEQREQAVRFQAAEAIAMPLDEAVLDYQVTGVAEAPGGPPQMKVVVVAARRSMVEALTKAVRGAGLKPHGIDLSAFSLVRILATPDAGSDAAQVFCHLGAVTNLAIAVGSTCLFTRPLSTQPEGDPMEVAAAMADEIRLSIDYYMSQPGALPVRDLVVSGPGARSLGLVEELASRLALPATVAKPLGTLDPSGVGEDDAYRYTIAAGLALGAAT